MVYVKLRYLQEIPKKSAKPSSDVIKNGDSLRRSKAWEKTTTAVPRKRMDSAEVRVRESMQCKFVSKRLCESWLSLGFHATTETQMFVIYSARAQDGPQEMERN